jgi:hypothetical protein
MKTLFGVAISVMSFLCVLMPQPALATIPLPDAPSWSSSDNDYSTGGAFADVNGDGWIDFLTSNGNDMNMDHNGVYVNNQGTLEAVASWRSSDNGYFGHCYAGDIDNDGDMDLAVGYLGSGGSGELTVRIYRNEGGTLGTAPWWKARDQHSSFDCCLGDVDNDGDLDLAISAGDAYQNETDSVRIYRNNGGTFDTLPFWTAHNGYCSDAVRFADIDNDGDLDLFVGQVIPSQDRGMVSMYRNNAGTLELTPSWVARPGVGWVLRLALGDYDGDGFLDLAAASNNQTGEPNSIKVFHNNGGTLDTVAAYTLLRSRRYSSCVAWGDVDGDSYPELAAGGWWEPAMVFDNQSGTLDTAPAWRTLHADTARLVCEALLWTDVDNSHREPYVHRASGDGLRHVFQASVRPLQGIDSVRVDGVPVPRGGWCADPLGGWVSLAAAPATGDTVAVFGTYSPYQDLAVTNWDTTGGNHLFLNTTPVGVAGPPDPLAASHLEAWPNPAAGPVTIALSGAATTPGQAVAVYDMTGRAVRTLSGTDRLWIWDGRDKTGKPVAPGVYFAALGSAWPGLKLVRVSQN